MAIPRAPSTSFFPYTTLFRSGQLHADQDVAGEDLVLDLGALAVLDLDFLARGHLDLVDVLLHVEAAEDRKSTRLNSSHSQNSYAVFCLKKKMKQHEGNTGCPV